MKKLDFKSFDGKNHSNKYIHQYTYTPKKRVSFGCNTTLGKENSINNNEKINKFLSLIQFFQNIFNQLENGIC